VEIDVEEHAVVCRARYALSGEKERSRFLFELARNGERFYLPLKMWDKKPVLIVGAYYGGESCLTGTDYWFEWDTGGEHTEKSHACNFDISGESLVQITQMNLGAGI
jgi:hypothetical protein